MTIFDDERARAELIALNARHIDLAILRLMRRLDAGEVRAYGLENSRKVFGRLAARYEAVVRRRLKAAA